MKSPRKLEAIKAWILTDGHCYMCEKKLTLEADNSSTMFVAVRDPDHGIIPLCASCSRRKRGQTVNEFIDSLPDVD